MTNPQIPGALNVFTIQPGSIPTNIGTVTNGSLINNNSSDTAVYVAGSSAVSISSGMRVGPYGSITWQQTGNVWIVCDPAATKTVTVTITDQVVNPQSPLDVADALINQGIPSKLLITKIGTYSLTEIGGSDWEIEIDGLSNYASIHMDAQDASGFDTPTGIYSFLEPDLYNHNIGWSGSFTATVTSDKIVIDNWSTFSITFDLYGYNRDIDPYTDPTIELGPMGTLDGVSISSGSTSYKLVPNDFANPVYITGQLWLALRLVYGDSNIVPFTFGWYPQDSSQYNRIVSSVDCRWLTGSIFSLEKMVSIPAAPYDVGIVFESALTAALTLFVDMYAIAPIPYPYQVNY